MTCPWCKAEGQFCELTLGFREGHRRPYRRVYFCEACGRCHLAPPEEPLDLKLPLVDWEGEAQT